MYSRKNGGNQMNESRVFMLNGTEVSGIHSIDPASEFYITIYGSIAQSESENISANQTAAVPVGSNKSLQIQSGGHPCQFLWRHGDHQLQRDIDRRRY